MKNWNYKNASNNKKVIDKNFLTHYPVNILILHKDNHLIYTPIESYEHYEF